MSFIGFSSYDEVLDYVRQHGHVYYLAPLDTGPVLVKASVGRRGVRMLPRPGQADPFDADASHLDRFRRPCGTANTLEIRLKSTGDREHLMVRNDEGLFVIPTGTTLPEGPSRRWIEIATVAVDRFGFVVKDRYGLATRTTDLAVSALVDRASRNGASNGLVRVLVSLMRYCDAKGLDLNSALRDAETAYTDDTPPNE